ncbi:MFS transporter [Ureibacillus acetophenoni]|uniref:Predicted MFS family arabinose efflux permease n=1 Tax=Ureibacillus acetophenoni TaxID=614649 RepID=A0A285U2M1_9BACL|nr:MFS transporter [Ureibacillus acetophenoni]SOC35963.1 predicted MFS family arabinose efflux permease [Ureibacillus acetophenoni]
MTQSKVHQPQFHLITCLLSISGLFILMSMYVPIPLTKTFMSHFTVTETEGIWIGSSFSLCYGICCLIYGPLSDHYGRNVFLIFGITFLSIVTLLCGFVDHYPTFVFLRILQAIGAAAFVPISLVYVAELYPPEKRLTAIGFITSGFLVASVVSQIFATIIHFYFGWKTIFFILGIIYFLLTIASITYLPNIKNNKHEKSIFSQFSKIKLLFYKKELLFSFSITFLLLFSLIGMYTILGEFLSESPFNFSEQFILFVRATGLIGIIITFFASRISKRFGVNSTFRFSLIISSLSLFLMGISSHIVFVIVFSVFFVAGIALLVPINIMLINIFAGDQKGTAVLFNAFILFIGASVGPLLATFLMQKGNSLIAFTSFSVILFLGFILSIFMNKRDVIS